MPTESRLFIKASLLHLILALGIGACWGAGAADIGPSHWAVLFPTYVHVFVVGWITQMIFGVAIWLFPRLTKETPRGSAALSYVALGSINLGLLTRAVAEPALSLGWGPAPWDWLLVVGAALQWLAGLAFVVNIWRRVKGR